MSAVVKSYAEAGFQKTDAAAWSPSATAGLTISGPNGRRYGGSLSAGHRATTTSNPRNEQGFPDAASAAYDCVHNLTSVTVPGDTSADASYVRANAFYGYDGSAGYLSIAGYYDLLRSAMLTGAIVPLSAEPVGYLPAGYADSLLAGFRTYGRCGRSGLTTGDIFVVQDVNGISSQNLGLSVRGSRAISRRLIASFGTNISSARLVRADSRLRSLASPYQIGRQLPGRPFLKGNAVLDYAVPNAPEVLVDAEYLGANNARNLPPNVTVNLGVEKRFSPTFTVNVILTNALNEYAGAFVSTQHAVFIPTPSGSFPTLAAPFPPASLHVTATWTIDRRNEP